MRPTFAIVPLALVLTLLGPAPKEADQAIAAFKARVVNAVSTQAFAWMPVPTASASKNAFVDQEAMNEAGKAAVAQR